MLKIAEHKAGFIGCLREMKARIRNTILNVCYVAGGGVMLLWGVSLVRLFFRSRAERSLDVVSLLIGMMVLSFGAFLVWIVFKSLYDDWKRNT